MTIRLITICTFRILEVQRQREMDECDVSFFLLIIILMLILMDLTFISQFHTSVVHSSVQGHHSRANLKQTKTRAN